MAGPAGRGCENSQTQHHVPRGLSSGQEFYYFYGGDRFETGQPSSTLVLCYVDSFDSLSEFFCSFDLYSEFSLIRCPPLSQ